MPIYAYHNLLTYFADPTRAAIVSEFNKLESSIPGLEIVAPPQEELTYTAASVDLATGTVVETVKKLRDFGYYNTTFLILYHKASLGYVTFFQVDNFILDPVGFNFAHNLMVLSLPVSSKDTSRLSILYRISHMTGMKTVELMLPQGKRVLVVSHGGGALDNSATLNYLRLRLNEQNEIVDENGKRIKKSP